MLQVDWLAGTRTIRIGALMATEVAETPHCLHATALQPHNRGMHTPSLPSKDGDERIQRFL
jgi:hypothetical protein